MDITGADKFNELTSTSNKLVMVDFWAEWCGPCRMLKPVLEDLAKKHADKVELVKVNVDEQDNYPLAVQYQVNSIPRVIFFKNGEKVDDFTGVVPPVRVEEIIQQHTADINATESKTVEMPESENTDTDMPMAA